MANRAGALRSGPLPGTVRLRERLLRTAGTLGLLLHLCLPALAVCEELAKVSPPKVEAAFLRNFAHYIVWPSHAFANDRAPWRICVVGNDPFGHVLDDTLQGRLEQGRAFVVVRAETLPEGELCQIVFVGYRTSESRRALLAELRKLPVLTVSNAPGFLQEGGVIRFQISDHVEFGVNLDHARAASLMIQTRMLEVAHEVVEDGVVRRRR